MLLALAWAFYLIPKALRHSDEAVRTRGVDRFSGSTRVLARREAVGSDARLVVPPARPASRPASRPAPQPAARPAPATAPTAAGPSGATSVAPSREQARRTAARVAARRRRRNLALLLVCVAGTAVAAGLGRAPGWAVAVPVALTALFLVLCRTQVRREPVPGPVSRRVEEAVDLVVDEPVVEAEHVEVHHDEPVQVRVDEHRVADFDDAEDTMGLSVAALREAVGVSREAGTLWDPLPMTLPTYVTKPKARRTVRTIDLGEPGTWTSGHTPQDAQLAARSDVVTPESDREATDAQRAVGS